MTKTKRNNILEISAVYLMFEIPMGASPWIT